MNAAAALAVCIVIDGASTLRQFWRSCSWDKVLSQGTASAQKTVSYHHHPEKGYLISWWLEPSQPLGTRDRFFMHHRSTREEEGWADLAGTEAENAQMEGFPYLTGGHSLTNVGSLISVCVFNATNFH